MRLNDETHILKAKLKKRTRNAEPNPALTPSPDFRRTIHAIIVFLLVLTGKDTPSKFRLIGPPSVSSVVDRF
jgi:hypothetical protein